jgi:hypothetical protein
MTAGLLEHVTDVLAQSQPFWQQLLRASATGTARLAVGLWIGAGPQQDIRLSAEQIRLLAELNAFTVFDVYEHPFDQ